MPTPPLRCTALLAAGVALLALTPGQGEAAWRVQLTPQVRVATEYSDNVTFADRDQKSISDLSLSVEPALEWSLDRGDLRLQGRSRERFERFLDNSDLNGNDPGHRVTLTWQPTERWTLEVHEDFARTRRLDDAIAAGEIVVQRERRTTNDAGATLTFRPTERVTLSAAYTNYNSQSSDPANTDYLLQMGQVTGSVQLTEQLGVSLGASVQDYDFNPFPGSRVRFFTRNYGLFLGTGYQVNERLQLSLQLGERLTEQTTRFPVVDTTTFPPRLVASQDTSSNLANTFTLSATYRLDRGTITFNASQDLTATAGAEGTVERRNFRLAAHRWVTPDWQVGGSANYATNKSDTQQQGFASRDSRTLGGSADLTYRFNDEWTGGLSLRHLQYRDSALGTQVSRNSVLLSLTARWPHLL